LLTKNKIKTGDVVENMRNINLTCKICILMVLLVHVGFLWNLKC